MKLDVREDYGIELSEVYQSISIKTDAGIFMLCQRDNGIEIRLNGGRWYSWQDSKGPVPLGTKPKAMK